MQNKTNEQNQKTDWPKDSLETVSKCPVCESSQRHNLHKNLSDQIFFCAPGQWTMVQCTTCATAYLNPRPTPSTIGLAYKNYFTHEEEPNFEPMTFKAKLRRSLANGYRNSQYGTQDHPANPLGYLTINLIPNTKATLDAGMRHLPKIKTTKRLLDMGCGNGNFLLRARSAGWDTVGLDFDPKAVETAQSHGLNVQLGSVNTLNPAEEQFDVITMSHVIEHVHKPIEVLSACYELLKPGGFLWLETPNIESQGHQIYGSAWRGLEPPRHLVLFTLESLKNALNKAGFTKIESQPYYPACEEMFKLSKAILEGENPYAQSLLKAESSVVKKAEQNAKTRPKCRELISLKAWKI